MLNRRSMLNHLRQLIVFVGLMCGVCLSDSQVAHAQTEQAQAAREQQGSETVASIRAAVLDVSGSGLTAPDAGLIRSPSIGSPLINSPSPKKAFFLSFLLPGLGQRYANGGAWSGWATTFALADAGLWAGLLGGEWRRDQIVESYTTLAASSAEADVDGKNRRFFINLATYHSSDEFLEVVLRNRAWDQIGYVEDPSFQWNWATDADFEQFRSLREDAESLRRRRAVLIAGLVINRLVSGIIAARSAGRVRRSNLTISVGTPMRGTSAPVAHVSLRY